MGSAGTYPQGSGMVKSRYATGFFGFSGALRVEPGESRTLRFRATTAQVNAGQVLLPALSGLAIRLLDAVLIAIGGAATTNTSVDLLGTRAGAAVRPLVVAVAALTQSTIVRAGASNAVVLADGASFTPLDVNTSLSITKQSGGSAMTVATAIDAFLTFVYE